MGPYSPAERLVRLLTLRHLFGRFPLTTRRLMREAVEVGVSMLPVPPDTRPITDHERMEWFWQIAPQISPIYRFTYAQEARRTLTQEN